MDSYKIYRFDQNFIREANKRNLTSPIFAWIESYENVIQDILDYYHYKQSFIKNTRKTVSRLISKNEELLSYVQKKNFFGTGETPYSILCEFAKVKFGNFTPIEYYKYFFNKRSDIAFCHHLKEKYPNANFSEIKNFFETNYEINKKLGKKEYIGICLTIAAVFTDKIPKPLIKSFGIDEELFSIVIFIIALSVVAYIAFFIGFEWYIFVRKTKKPREFILNMLKQLVIFEIIPNKANSADAKNSAAD